MSCSMTPLFSSSHPPPSSRSCPTPAMSCLSSPPGDHRNIPSRPKLTLQTTSLPRTFGSSTTGLSFSFATGPGASPTVRNTFKNAYDVSSPSSATSSPSKSSNPRFSNSKPTSPYPTYPNNTNACNYRSPYQLPLGVRSILRNSPLEPATRRRSGSVSAGASGPGGAGTRRVFFPIKKQVSYRLPLEEEIHTEQYTAQHLDLVQEEIRAVHDQAAASTRDILPNHSTNDDNEEDVFDSDSSLSLSESSTSHDEASGEDENTVKITLSKFERKKRRTMRIERQVRAVALLDGLGPASYASSTPQTPRQGRVKRLREWKWTLGPIDTASKSVVSEPNIPIASETLSSIASELQEKPTSSQ